MKTEQVKKTKQRKAVADLLLSITKFSSAQEVHSLLAKRGEKVGLATVYRTLQALSETGAVDILRNETGEALYRACGSEHHHHLVCTKCSKTSEISAPAIEAWTEKIAIDNNYQIQGHTIEIFGICRNCL
jgi:Fur family ferric uptake transcriptional regulator